MTIYSLDHFFPNMEPICCSSLVLTVGSWPAYRFLRMHVRWSAIPIYLRIFQFVVICTVKGFRIANDADVFLEFSCFFYDPSDVDSLISGSSAFSKSSLNIWKFWFTHCWSLTWRILSITFASLWDECNWAVVWAFFGISFLRDWNENLEKLYTVSKNKSRSWMWLTSWTEIKSTLEGTNSRITEAEDRISEVEDRMV